MASDIFTDLPEVTSHIRGLRVDALIAKFVGLGYVPADDNFLYGSFGANADDGYTYSSYSWYDAPLAIKESYAGDPKRGVILWFPGVKVVAGVSPYLLINYDSKFTATGVKYVKQVRSKTIVYGEIAAFTLASIIAPLAISVLVALRDDDDRKLANIVLVQLGGQVAATAIEVQKASESGKVTLGTVAAVAGVASSGFAAYNVSPLSSNLGNSMEYSNSFETFNFTDSNPVNAVTDAQNVSYGFNTMPGYDYSLSSSVDANSLSGAFDSSGDFTGYFGGATADASTSLFGTQFLGGEAPGASFSDANYPPAYGGTQSSWSNQAQEYLGVISAGAKAVGAVAGVYGALTARPQSIVSQPSTVHNRQSSLQRQNEANIRPIGTSLGQLFTSGAAIGGSSSMWIVAGGALVIGAAFLWGK